MRDDRGINSPYCVNNFAICVFQMIMFYSLNLHSVMYLNKPGEGRLGFNL